MTVTNADIASAFNEFADILDLEGENMFRARAYRSAARVIEDLAHDVNRYIAEGNDLKDLPHIGKDLEHRIIEIVETGKMACLEQARKRVPAGVSDLLHIHGLGPRKVAHLTRDLHIHSLNELAVACHEHKVRQLDGFGEITERQILDQIEGDHPREHRMKLCTAEQYGDCVIEHLLLSGYCRRAVAAGSLRRRRETVANLDIVVSSAQPALAIKHATGYGDIRKVLVHADTHATFVLNANIQVDVRAVEEEAFGAALLYYTGSKEHNIVLRQMARERGLKLSERGLFENGVRLPFSTEASIYHQLGMSFVAPELRENKGEIRAALRGELPRLIEIADLRGDLHCHTKASDGRNSLLDMAEGARRAGLTYLAVSDHCDCLKHAHGMSERRLMQQLQEIDELNSRLEGIKLLKAMEVDILEDGSLDMPEEVLRRLDLTVCSIHSGFNLSRQEQTSRIIKAMDNPYFTIFGHPSCRLISERRPIRFDLDKVIVHALKRRCVLELNSHAERLDLDDVGCLRAREAGVLVAINSDAHSVYDFEDLRFGIGQARRGWLEARNVLNTRSYDELKDFLASRRS